MSGSVPLGSSAFTSEKWQGHCTAQMAYIRTWKILSFPWWKQCIASMLHPCWFAKNPLSDLGRRNILLQPNFLWHPVFGEVDRSLSWFWHWAYKSQCKSPDLLSCALAQTALHHGLWLGQIAPTSNISFMWAWTSSTIRGGILQNLSWKVHHQQPWSHDF